MKKVVLLFLTMCLACLAGHAQGVEFTSGTWEEVLAKAKAENKVIFVDVYTQWCGPCKQVANKVFPEARLGEYYNKHFINYKVDAESPAGKEFVKKYPVSGYPTFFYINGEGMVINKTAGARDVDGFLQEAGMIEMYNRHGGIENMMAAIKNGTASKEMCRDYYESASKRDKPKALNSYLKAMSPEELIAPDNSLIEEISEYDRDLENRLADEIVKFSQTEKFQDKKFRQAYSFDIVFPVHSRISGYIDQAIQKGDAAFLEEMLKLKERYAGYQWRLLDGDLEVMKGRGLFFATPEYIKLCYMCKNRVDEETFKTNLPVFMEKLMQQLPADSSLVDYQKDLIETVKKGEKVPSTWDIFRRNLMSVGDYTAHNILAWTDCYWKLSPSDKQTRKQCSEWIRFAFRMNLVNPNIAVPAAYLLAKIGNPKEGIAILETAIEEQRALKNKDQKIFKDLEDNLQYLKNGKL